MFLPHAREPRLVTAYLLFMITLVTLLPKADISETLFDEANTPMDEIVVEEAASSRENRPSVTAFAPRIFSRPRRTGVRKILPDYAARSTDSRTLRELFCSLLC